MSVTAISAARTTRTVSVLFALVALAASCSTSDDSADGTTTTSGATVTTAAASADTTTDASTETTVEAGTGSDVAPTTSAGVASSAPTPSGSGCSPGTANTADGLPDGRWFVYIGALVEAAGPASVTFDLACWFTGDDAAIAAAEDGEESPPPNDYHVRNDSDLLRVQPVAVDAEVSWMPDPANTESAETIPYLDWLDLRLDRPFQPGAWIIIENGEIIAIEEQYVP